MSLPPTPSLTLLIVDDDPMMRLGLATALANQPEFTVLKEAENGQSGVSLALTLHPTVVLMDMGMVGMDGIAATRQIKTANPAIRIVMLTSHTDEMEILAALAAGADAYCVKGTNLNALTRAIQVAAAGGAYLDPLIAGTVMQNLGSARPQTPQGQDLLSDRELEVLTLIVEGRSNTEIGQQLYLSPHTVKTYVKAIMNKLMVSDRVQAAVAAVRQGLVP
jgi:DNA-binding NarL/FixJ family response regulator